MAVMSRKEEELLDRLIEIAGDAELLRQIIVDLNATLGRAPEVAEVVREILRRRYAGANPDGRYTMKVGTTTEHLSGFLLAADIVCVGSTLQRS